MAIMTYFVENWPADMHIRNQVLLSAEDELDEPNFCILQSRHDGES